MAHVSESIHLDCPTGTVILCRATNNGGPAADSFGERSSNMPCVATVT